MAGCAKSSRSARSWNGPKRARRIFFAPEVRPVCGNGGPASQICQPAPYGKQARRRRGPYWRPIARKALENSGFRHGLSQPVDRFWKQARHG